MRRGATGCLTAWMVAGAAAGQPVGVRIEHFAFMPEVVEVEVGQTVRWENRDAIEHTATAQTGPGTLVPSGVFDSGLLSLGGVFEHTFAEAGAYHYYCVPHGGSMQGVVVVRARPPCAADLNGDGVVDPDDLADAIACYFAQPGCHEADLNGDGLIDPDDLADAIGRHFLGCP